MIRLSALLGRALKDESGEVFGHVVDVRFSGSGIHTKDFAAAFLLYGRTSLIERMGLAVRISEKVPVEEISEFKRTFIRVSRPATLEKE
jgi:hypothetical protein